MIKYVQSELLKQKRCFNNTVVWIFPLITILIAFLLMGPSYVQKGAFNWWYVMFLPFTFTFVSSSIVKKEIKRNYHGLLGIFENKKQIWYAKIITSTIYLFITCFIFFAAITICGLIFESDILISKCFLGSLLLFITFMWQIPFFMFIAQKTSTFLTVIISMICNLGIACICGVKECWWIPFSIPARLMCPTIGVLPNGLPVELGSILNDSNVILPGVIITVSLYVILAGLTAHWFNKKEV